MYFSIMKVTFETEHPSTDETDARALKALAEKIRTRFKVSAAADLSNADEVIVIAALSSSKANLSQTLDHILAFCEQSGFGRIAREDTLFDHLDSLIDQ